MSALSIRGHAGTVFLSTGSATFQLTPSEARSFAGQLICAAAAAEQAPLEPPPSSDGLDEVWDAVMRKSS